MVSMRTRMIAAGLEVLPSVIFSRVASPGFGEEGLGLLGTFGISTLTMGLL